MPDPRQSLREAIFLDATAVQYRGDLISLVIFFAIAMDPHHPQAIRAVAMVNIQRKTGTCGCVGHKKTSRHGPNGGTCSFFVAISDCY